MPLAASRGNYKRQLTIAKNTIEGYRQDPGFTQRDDAIDELKVQRDIISRIETKYSETQFRIIEEAAQESLEAKAREQVELDNFLAECADLDTSITRWIASLISARQPKDSPEVVRRESSANQSVTEVVSTLTQALQEQREQLLAAQQRQQESFQQMIGQRTHGIDGGNHDDTYAFQTHMKLEPLRVPPFSGDYSEWSTFQDLFASSIELHPFLTKAQKMQYLLNALRGQAKEIVGHLAICDANYEVAWRCLEQRYEDTQSVVKAHIDKFLDQPRMSRPNVTELRKIQTSTASAIHALDAIKVTKRDPWLIQLTLAKVDAETQRMWAQYDLESPTWGVFNEFLHKRCRALEHCAPSEVVRKSPQEFFNKKKGSVHVNADESYSKCIYCKTNSHKLYRCKTFLSLSVKKRLDVVKELKICPNCLSDFHPIESCAYPLCKLCNLKHNRLLHEATTSVSTNAVTSKLGVGNTGDPPLLESKIPNDASGAPSQSTALSCSGVNSKVLFATAVVSILDKDGNPHDCRIVLDPTSQVNIISTNLCQMLRLKCSQTNFAIDGVGDLAQVCRQETRAEIVYHQGDMMCRLPLSCLVMKKVTADQPNWDIDSSKIPIPLHFQLADPTWFRRQRIDLLIGGAHSWNIMLPERFNLGDGMPTLWKSIFGWLVVGPCFSTSAPERASCNITTLAEIDTNIVKFWVLEEVPNENSIRSKEQEEVEELFVKTTTRNPEGRYIVQLPFNENLPDLSTNRGNAIKQLGSLEHRLSKNPDLKESYQKIFDEYLELGIIEPVPYNELRNASYYLPHHCVVKESSTTTKVRIVFNASSKSQSGLSLNDCTKTGPVVQPMLVSTLWKFRLHEIAMTCDVTKMYLQVLLHPPHKDYQRFMWRVDGQLRDFRFRTVCFGVAPSAFLATRVLNAVADDEGSSYPLAASVLRGNFYVDDCLYSAPTVEEMIATKTELIELLGRGGMTLAKFQSNRLEVLSSPSQEEQDTVSWDADTKTLGVIWNPKRDTFSFKVSTTIQQSGVTKRYILSVIGKIFDPCGFIGPITVVAKLILQAAWALKLSWDEVVPDDLAREWFEFTKDLPRIEELQIPRWISTISDVVRRELHAFCDASIVAYGAVVYVICVDRESLRTSRFFTSRSRITPVKSKEENKVRILTIPKTELEGALLAARLVKEVRDSLGIEHCFFWTDATVVLHQIYNPTGKREVIVKNRVEKILNLTVATQWRHVRSKENPADVLSRGSSAQRLLNDSLWWYGPEWLCKSEEAWPPPFSPSEHAVTMAISSTEVDEEADEEVEDDETEIEPCWREQFIKRYWSFTRMVRILARCRRIFSVAKLRYRRRLRMSAYQEKQLSVSEVREAEAVLVKWDQEKHFKGMIPAIASGGQSKDPQWKLLRNLRPFLDENGVVRVGGRLQHSRESYDARHPMILPKKSELARVVAMGQHRVLLHGGPQLMLSHIRQRFWPLKGRSLVRKVAKDCVTCKKVKPTLGEQIMGELPSSRVTLDKPFNVTGVDLTGHFFIKRNARGTSLEKVYVVVFVCMATKAVHLELVSSLSTEAFIAALRRFTARRGIPARMFSDNATNFVGASKELKNLWKAQNFKESVTDFMSGLCVEWTFIPPRAPHHGGLWESAVKSFKYHFRRIVGGNVLLNYEEMYTVLTQIEAVLNSRPLVPLTDHVDDMPCLTPGKFLLMGSTPMQLPDPDLSHLKITYLSRWQLCQRLTQDFAKQFKRDYLNTLQARAKWNKEHRNFKVGDVVLIVDQECASTGWPMGLITHVRPGPDGAVRTATVKTTKGCYDRVIQKLVKLLPEEDIQEDC